MPKLLARIWLTAAQFPSLRPASIRGDLCHQPENRHSDRKCPWKKCRPSARRERWPPRCRRTAQRRFPAGFPTIVKLRRPGRFPCRQGIFAAGGKWRGHRQFNASTFHRFGDRLQNRNGGTGSDRDCRILAHSSRFIVSLGRVCRFARGRQRIAQPITSLQFSTPHSLEARVIRRSGSKPGAQQQRHRG